MTLNEAVVEDTPCYAAGHRPHLAPGEPAAERDSFAEVVLVGTASLMQKNRAIHWALCDDIFKTKPDALN